MSFARAGAYCTVEYPTESMPQAVERATEGKLADCCIDTVGGNWFDQAVRWCVTGVGPCRATGAPFLL